MKKIGIITLYQGSVNYGGVLQAYALCRALKKLGYEAEQIRFARQRRNLSSRAKKMFAQGLKGFLRWGGHYFRQALRSSRCKKEERKQHVRARRAAVFRAFNHRFVPQSSKIWTDATIGRCVTHYDAFVTGSDQVWNMDWYSPAYFLEFVPSDKIKISYAASIAKTAFTKEQEATVARHLEDFDAISLREQDAVRLIAPLSAIEPTCVLDPTLLLDRAEWEEACAERTVDGDYVFCYFLDENSTARKLAKRFAKRHGLKLVAIPHASGRINLLDLRMGAQLCYDAGPSEFLSLIKHAKYVFTDSFHAVVFSNVYETPYFVFPRNRHGDMSSRITGITEKLGQTQRFCSGERQTLDYVEDLARQSFFCDQERLAREKEHSKSFLSSNLGKQ